MLQLQLQALGSILLATSALAHFNVFTPGDRGNTHDTQTEAPCGGIDRVVLPRFLFNPDGTPIGISNSHDHAHATISICTKDECLTNDDFDTLLLPEIHISGAGNFCIPDVPLPDSLAVGSNATIQVAMSAHDGYLYNCIDITASDKGATSAKSCSNSTGVSAHFVESSGNSTDHDHDHDHGDDDDDDDESDTDDHDHDHTDDDDEDSETDHDHDHTDHDDDDDDHDHSSENFANALGCSSGLVAGLVAVAAVLM